MIEVLLEAERETMNVGKQSRIKEILTVRRNRNAMIASEIVMFMQQFWYVRKPSSMAVVILTCSPAV